MRAALKRPEFSAGGSWISPELLAEPMTDVAVLPGDFLQWSSAGGCPSAVHRVVRPPPGATARFSVPLLLRAPPAFDAYEERYRADRGTTLRERRARTEERLGRRVWLK